ncbi:MMPL family transporter [Thalassotalea sp. M1531]|uniref:MMPL family transporter n=2 Tax=Thalassotalea algicola TaxID=2716224 RepID=A0A7Y0Q7L4_9GAMM|nr:MMPL family transporter [Thalassotalea algicola]
MLSREAPARVFHNQTKSKFTMHDMVVIGAVSNESVFTQARLSDINKVSNFVLSLDGVIKQDLLALNVVDNIKQERNEQDENLGIRFEYLMKQSPHSEEEAKAVKHAVKRLPMLDNTLVSGDDKAVAIYVPIKSKDLSYSIAEQVREFTNNLDSTLQFYITGLPVAEDQFGYEMFVQMGVAAPLAGVAIFLLLWYFFRNFPLIFAPMIVAMATVVITMGSLIGMGFTVHIMSSMIAIFLMPIAVVDSVHILSEFSEHYKKGDDVKATLKKVMSHLYTPMLYTSVTSAVGFYSLMLTPIPPVKVFGAFIGSGILLAFVLTIIFIPAYVSRLSEQTLERLHLAVSRLERKSALSKTLLVLGGFAQNKAKLILMSFIAVFVFSIEGINRIEINDNPTNWFKTDHEIRVADKTLNAHFAGTYDAWLVLDTSLNKEEINATQLTELLAPLVTASVVNKNLAQELTLASKGKQLFSEQLLVQLDDLSFDADEKYQTQISKIIALVDYELTKQKTFMQPDMLNWIAKLQSELINTGLVGKVNSLADIVRTVNRELFSGNEEDFVIPASASGVAQTLLQYQSSHRPKDLWHFVTKDYTSSLLWLQMTSGDNQHTTQVVQWVENYVAANPAPIDINVNWAGKSYLNIVWQDAMVSGMLDSLLSSFAIVFLMMVLLFRSVKYGVLAMLPLTFTITMIYGLIGWLGKSYDMPIAVLSALTLGLSIDFAIHFLQRTRELEIKLGSLLIALQAMFNEPSRAISRNAIVIAIGFTPLLLSPLVPYVTVGAFLASIMAISALVTLILLPACLTLLNGNSLRRKL